MHLDATLKLQNCMQLFLPVTGRQCHIELRIQALESETYRFCSIGWNHKNDSNKPLLFLNTGYELGDYIYYEEYYFGFCNRHSG